VLLTQSAYQTGWPMLTLPVIAAVTPMASVAVGIGLLGESPRAGVPGAVAAGFAVLVASLALACLARSVPHPESLAPHRETALGHEAAGEPCQPDVARMARVAA
jgi:hypothetical protein